MNTPHIIGWSAARSLRSAFIGLAALVSCATSAQATIIVAEDNFVYNGNINRFAGNELVQSFRQASGNIAGVRARFENQGSTATAPLSLTVSLYDALPGNGGNLLTSGTVSGIIPAANEFEIDFFWAAIAITPETELFLLFESSDGDYGPMGINAGNNYTRGDYYLNGNNSGKAPDLAFLTYTDTNFSAVPAPGMIAIFAIGLAGMAAMRRRAQAKDITSR